RCGSSTGWASRRSTRGSTRRPRRTRSSPSTRRGTRSAGSRASATRTRCCATTAGTSTTSTSSRARTAWATACRGSRERWAWPSGSSDANPARPAYFQSPLKPYGAPPRPRPLRAPHGARPYIFAFVPCGRLAPGRLPLPGNPAPMAEPPIAPGPLLAQIDSPADLRRLPLDRLPEVCDELRQYIIDVVSVHGGHFGASLGVVELTVALHWAYDTPDDLLVWDVGHQAYGHKILTGRRDVFPTSRKYRGISGFPKRSEREYATFGVAHASTSISGALGLSIARGLAGSDRKVVAVIGDGSMTGGLAFEGLNNAGAADTDLV